MQHPLIGKAVTFGPLDVTPESISAFHRGINETGSGGKAHPMYCATAVIPGTGAVLFQPEGNFNVNRIVQGGIDIRFHEPARPGDRLETESRLIAIEEKSSGNVLRIAYAAKRNGGGLVADGETRYFIRGKKTAESSAAAEPPAADLPGTPVGDLRIETLKNQSLLYAEGSGDRFFIHTDDAFAQSVGLPGMIMHGMCTLALSVRAVIAAALGGDAGALRTLSCKFSHIVLPGDTLRVVISRTASGELAFETLTPAGKRAITEGRITH